LLVAESWRGRGLGRTLLREAFERAGGVRIDLLSRAGDYYVSLGAEEISGFRLTRANVEPTDF
jgi:GNAT superfamily N-acetyltransferase